MKKLRKVTISDRRGFTLIELLVVIAIIGFLAAVVLVATSSARTKGNDGAIKSNLDNARAQAELYYYANGNSYQNLCIGSVGTVNGLNPSLVVAGNALGGGTPNISYDNQRFVYHTNVTLTGTIVCNDSATGWAAIVSLKNPTVAGSGWCVDYTGFEGETTILNPFPNTRCGQ